MNPLSIHQSFRTTIETAFYHNHVKCLNSRSDIYDLACQDPASIVTDIPVHHTQELGLPKNAKVLVDNNGSIVGRTAAARVIVTGNKNMQELKVLQDCIRANHERTFYKTDIHIGLHENFEVNAHIMVPDNQINNLYNTVINFESGLIENPKETLYLYVDANWRDPNYPHGLVVLDPESHVGAVLGLNYFGEIKKALLSLTWNASKLYGYIPCHGGVKYLRHKNREETIGVFGLSGSGKSTITFSKPKHADDVQVLHDDAFIIHEENLSTIALEPSYFDKTADYAMDHPDIASFVSVQNNGVTKDKDGNLVLVTEDIRNGNGRCIKSRYARENRVDYIETPLTHIFWIMRDDAFPPCVQITDPALAAVMGATLTTTRSNAENTKEVGKLVIEPYANPFRIYPLVEDYQQFKNLFSKQNVKCYVLNTGHFDGKKVTPETTFDAIDQILTDMGEFVTFGSAKTMKYLVQENFKPDMNSQSYLEKIKKTFELRHNFLADANAWTWLPQEAHESIKAILSGL